MLVELRMVQVLEMVLEEAVVQLLLDKMVEIQAAEMVVLV